jgi:hypothetical protein
VGRLFLSLLASWGGEFSSRWLLGCSSTDLQGQASQEGDRAMALSNNKKEGCVVFIHESGDTRRRRVDELSYFSRGGVERKLTGDRLPKSISLRLGASQHAFSVLELFDERFRQAPPVERSPGINGRDALAGIVAVVGFHVVLALLDAVARAM